MNLYGMTRESALEHFVQHHVGERWLEDVLQIDEDYKREQSRIDDELIQAFATVCEQIRQYQYKEEKGSIRYIYISFLRTRLLAGEAKYRIDAYDEKWFLDPVECTTLWSADVVLGPLLERHTQWEQTRKTYGRYITPMDLEDLLQLEAMKYHMLVLSFLQGTMPDVMTHPMWGTLQTTEDLTVFAGEYRDQSEVIWSRVNDAVNLDQSNEA